MSDKEVRIQNWSAPMVDCAMIRKYFAVLYAGTIDVGAVGLYVADDRGRPIDVAFLDPRDIDGMVNTAAELAGRGNVFCSIDVIDPTKVDDILRRGGRGREDELSAMVALRADVDAAKPGSDTKKHNYPPRPHIPTTLDAMPLPPSLVVGSGSEGVHAYWILREPEPIDGRKKLRELKRLSKDWQALLRANLGVDTHGRAYDLDYTHDLARVLRPAGTINHKHGRCVEIIEDTPARRYSIEELVAQIDARNLELY
ncbi:MAG: hypothetical protein GX621_03445 [Pirellulaceae bacterium]|nr:hypothetical protein [Pirellulaceae bacterium]